MAAPARLHSRVFAAYAGSKKGPNGGERGDISGALATRLLGRPTAFEASKLKVEFVGDGVNERPLSAVPRAYALTHCDLTANLTLAVSNSMISSEQLRSWQAALRRDGVVAEWRATRAGMSLHVHCLVCGANPLQRLAAGFRYHVFSKELPLVLKAVVHGDAELFSERPELRDSVVWVYFHSSADKYNRVECWGPLKDAAKRSPDHGRSEGRRRAGVIWSALELLL